MLKILGKSRITWITPSYQLIFKILARGKEVSYVNKIAYIYKHRIISEYTVSSGWEIQHAGIFHICTLMELIGVKGET